MERASEKVKVERFPNRAACEAKYSGSEFFCYCGPIHKHDGILFLQVYLGQHEWAAINVDNPTDVRQDPGYEGSVFGWGHVIRESMEFITDHMDWSKKLANPESSHPAITHDELLFADQEKLETYLGVSLENYDEKGEK